MSPISLTARPDSLALPCSHPTLRCNISPLGNPTGLDYIEKILQVPYRVRSVQPEAVSQFLGAQMQILQEKTEIHHGQAATNGVIHPPEPEPSHPQLMGRVTKLDLPPEVILFTKAEYEIVKTTCEHTILTPRSLKRIVNVLKLIKIFWHRQGETKSAEVIRTVVGLLALSARYPEIMCEVFPQLEMQYRKEPAASADQFQTFAAFMEGFVILDRSTSLHLMRKQKDFAADAAVLLPPVVTLQQVGLRSFHLVRAFSFVGDPASVIMPVQQVALVGQTEPPLSMLPSTPPKENFHGESG